MNENPAFTQALQDLGMTKTEAEVYLATLQTSTEEPVSGYKVAQVMGRDPANLSKTLAHLVKVGAVRLVQARPRHYVGVPVAEFTEMLMARMEESREKAVTLMARLGSSTTSQQPTPLENTAHILAQARRILSQSRGNVVLCCDDETLHQLEEFLQDMGRNFPDLAFVFADSPRDIPGIKIFAHNGSFPMSTGFSDNTTENWILVAANNGQWLSAFYTFTDPSENTHGWVGTNHEISLPIKAVIEALLVSSNVPSAPAVEEPVEPEPTPIEDLADEIAQDFEAGAIASVTGDQPVDDEPLETAPENEEIPPEEPMEAAPVVEEVAPEEAPTEEGFKFLVQHDDEEDEDDDLPKE